MIDIRLDLTGNGFGLVVYKVITSVSAEDINNFQFIYNYNKC